MIIIIIPVRAIDGATKAVKENLALLLTLIAGNEGLRVPEYNKILNASERTIERYLKQLREVGLIEFKGDASQTGGYYLTMEMKAKLK